MARRGRATDPYFLRVSLGFFFFACSKSDPLTLRTRLIVPFPLRSNLLASLATRLDVIFAHHAIGSVACGGEC